MNATLRARLANAARTAAMQKAHASARLLREHYPAEDYADCLRAALRERAARVPRCAPVDLCEQAEAWADCARIDGARFDIEEKATDAVRFSIDNDLASLAVPSKLVGTASYQDAAAAVATRIESRGGWALCERDGAAVFALGLRLGNVQPKHAATWLPSLDGVRPVRLAVTAVTGGDVFIDRTGQARRKTRGVNVAFEVGAAALDWASARRTAGTDDQETVAELQARLADLF